MTITKWKRCVLAIAAVILLTNCTVAQAVPTEDIDLLIWAYGLIPTDVERTQLENALKLDEKELPSLREDLDTIHAFRKSLASESTLTYMGQWASLNSRLMSATPAGRTTQIAHNMQTKDTGERRFCASSSVELMTVGFVGKSYVCGAYRFLISVAARGRIMDVYLTYAPLERMDKRGTVDWRTLTHEWQVVADPPKGAPIAMKLIGTELFMSVAPPRRSDTPPPAVFDSRSIDPNLVGSWVWSNLQSGAAAAMMIRKFRPDGVYEEMGVWGRLRKGRYTASADRLRITYTDTPRGVEECSYAVEGNILALWKCSSGNRQQNLMRDHYVK